MKKYLPAFELSVWVGIVAIGVVGAGLWLPTQPGAAQQEFIDRTNEWNAEHANKTLDSTPDRVGPAFLLETPTTAE